METHEVFIVSGILWLIEMHMKFRVAKNENPEHRNFLYKKSKMIFKHSSVSQNA